MLTESTEMYLITVYRLTCNVREASIRDIAARMNVSLASASEKVKHLTEQGYLHHEWREGVALSEQGRQIALRVLRKNRLIAAFLVQMADYQIDEVPEEACRLEHAISDRLADRLEALLGYPQVDPHGYPIPSRDGTIAMDSYPSLADASPGDTVMVQCLHDLDSQRLRYIRTLGLLPGTQLVVRDVAPFEGPITLEVGTSTVVIARALAQQIGILPTTQEVH